MKKIGIIILLAVILIVSGCTTNSKPETSIVTPTSTYLTQTIPPAPTPTQLTDDEKFLNLVSESSVVLIEDAHGLSKASLDYNDENLQLYGKYLKDDSQKYYDDLNELSISSELEPAFEEYNQSLSTFHSLGFYAESDEIYKLNNNGHYLLVDKANVGIAHINRALTLSKN